MAIFLGFFVGTLVGFTSIGGGALLTPCLILILHISPSIAIATDLFVGSITKFVGAGTYAIRREVNWEIVGRLASGSVPGAILGTLLMNYLPKEDLEPLLKHLLGLVLILAAASSWARSRYYKRISEPKAMPSFVRTMIFGFLVGFIVSMTSIGSGSVLLLIMTLFFPIHPKTIVGTDLMHAVVLCSAASLGHLLKGRVDFHLARSILIGAVPGVLLGAQLVLILPARIIRTVLTVVLMLVGLLMLLH
ncbi:MAG TPA: sulfite exporter TauE/SafE family protein [Bdellovibrionota bacterium]|nr:sulfite exporter TauE/SafE family protein [Bdellovibrionota bacterium]